MTKKSTYCLWGLGKIGTKIAKKILLNDLNLIILDSNDKNMVEINNFENSANNAIFINTDITKISIKDILSIYGKLDFKIESFINCTYPSKRDKKMEGRDIDSQMESSIMSIQVHFDNYYKFLLSSKKYLQENKIEGSVVSLSSMYGSNIPDFNIYEGNNHNTPDDYVVAKAGLNMLSKYFAKTMLQDKIRFNTISPGGVSNNQDEEFVKKYTQKSLNNRMLAADDIAPLAYYLLSDQSSMVTGQDFIIDGGFNI